MASPECDLATSGQLLNFKKMNRFAAMLHQRRLWAEENQLSPDVIENVYRDLAGYFIEQELKIFSNE